MVADAGVLAVEMLLAAFAGGALGASIGALPAFSFAGIAITVGEIANIANGSGDTAGVADPAALGTVGITKLVGLGPALGPHVAFAGGAAAAAFAARKDYLDDDYEYHKAKQITTPLGTRPDVLVVGGVFGMAGYLVTQLSVVLALPWDPIAASIVVSALVHRLVFGYPLLGRLDSSILDMSPFERGERRTLTDGGQAEGRVTRYVVEPWLPYQYEWSNVAILGLAVGLFGAFLAVETGSYFLAFGITAASLVFLNVGLDRFPVTHHMALPASIAALAAPAAAGATGAVLIGGLFGVLGGLLGELAQRVLYAHADTHLDPPAVSIVLTTLLIALLDLAGVFQTELIPMLYL